PTCLGCGAAIGSSQDNMETPMRSAAGAWCRLLARLAVGKAGIARLEQADLAFRRWHQHCSGLRARVGRYRVQLTGAAAGFLGMRRANRAQVVRGLKAAPPRQLVGFVELLSRRTCHIDVQ